MATRSTTSEYQPMPPNTRLNTIKTGQLGSRVAIHNGNTTNRAMNPGPNVCTAPTGGTTKGKSIRANSGG